MLWNVVDHYIDYTKERPSVLVKVRSILCLSLSSHFHVQVAQVVWREEQWLAARVDAISPADRDVLASAPRTEGHALDGRLVLC